MLMNVAAVSLDIIVNQHISIEIGPFLHQIQQLVGGLYVNNVLHCGCEGISNHGLIISSAKSVASCQVLSSEIPNNPDLPLIQDPC